ncbi:uncharacterized protein [Amphiura filiformis]|uniref:uncharacterized protein n=1 Tax=Amphiura filiformis TaxID=82378 RepID=UPI003B20E8C4
MMQDPADIPDSPESPSSDDTLDTSPFIRTVQITPLMRNRGYKEVNNKSSDEEDTTHKTTNSSQEKSQKDKTDSNLTENSIKIEAGINSSCNQDKTVDLNNGPAGESSEGHLAKSKIHQCLACEMDDIVNTAAGENSGANTVKVPHTHDVDIADALDAGVSGQNDQKGSNYIYIPPAKEGNEDRAIVSEDGKKLLFPCLYCEKTFSRKDSRKRHERIHTQDKPHKCTICEKAFITTSHLKTHFLTHTGVKEFVCNFCDKAFHTSDKRNRHEKTHLKDVTMPEMPADLETKAGVAHPVKSHNASSLIEDIPNIEKPDQIEDENGVVKFKCRFCTKSFPRIDSRKRHERTHTGQKPHKCSFCEHSFVTAYHKRLHERVHTKEKPYECGTCNKGFSRMDSLRRHEKLHE